MNPREDAAFWEGFRQGFIVALIANGVIGIGLGVLIWALLS